MRRPEHALITSAAELKLGGASGHVLEGTVSNIGPVWFTANFATTKLRQSVAYKMATTSVARIGKKLSL